MDGSTPTRDELTGAALLLDELIRRNAEEGEFQRLFREHPHLLSRTLRLRHEPTEVVPLGRPGRSEPDFVLFPNGDNPHGVYGVLEIKRPSTKLIVERRKRILTLSADARTAVDQVNQYAAEMNTSPVFDEGHLVILGARAHLFIVAGLSQELAKHIGSDLHERDLLPLNCDLIPYDSLLQWFQQTIPPLVHVLVPDLAVVDGRIEFVTVTDTTPLGGIRLGSSPWETPAGQVFRALSIRGDAGQHVVRVAREVATGELVGAAVFQRRLDLMRHDSSFLRGAAYIPAIDVREPYRYSRMPDGVPVPDAQMEDLLSQVNDAFDNAMPKIWCAYPADDDRAGRLLTTHGFSRLEPFGKHDVWLRPEGIAPTWWRGTNPG